MTPAEDMGQRHARMLSRYADLSLSLAEDVHAVALAADDPDRKARLADGFHKLGRAMRQALALEARFARDQAADRRLAEAGAADARRAAVTRRQEQVRAKVERQIWCEVEPRDAPAWLADLNERLEEEALYDGFDDEAVQAHIDRLSAELGLTGETVRDYTPRALRSRLLSPRDLAPAFSRLFGRLSDEDDEDEDDAGAFDDDDEAPDDDPPPGGQGAARAEAPFEPARPPPVPAPRAPECNPPEPPTPEPPPPEPEPPPDPPPPPQLPPPEPYIPPWERHPNGVFPGGSGY